MRVQSALGVLTALVALGSGQAWAADYAGQSRVHRLGHHAAVGECVRTRVEAIGPVPGGGPAIRYADGVVQEFDAALAGQIETRPGDPVRLCLVAFTRDCGAVLADERPGRTYATGNLRTGAAWTAPDIRSSCAAR